MNQNKIKDDICASCPNCLTISTSHTEKRKTFRVERYSNKNERIFKIQVDNCLICGTKSIKCDYTFIRETPSEFYFVEFKGEDIIHAYNQILETIKFFRTKVNINKQQIEAFIISSSIPKATNSKFNNLIIDFKKNHGKSLIRQTDTCIKRI